MLRCGYICLSVNIYLSVTLTDCYSDADESGLSSPSSAIGCAAVMKPLLTATKIDNIDCTKVNYHIYRLVFRLLHFSYIQCADVSAVLFRRHVIGYM